MSLLKRCAIITGGASGIGRDLVLRLTSQGVNTVFGDINSKDGIELQDKVNSDKTKQAKAIFVPCDVRQLADFNKLFSTAFKEFGGAQIVVNNAGIFPKEDIENSTDFIDNMMDINLKATYVGTSLAISHFRQQKGNPSNCCQDFSVVNVSSVSALTYFPTRSVYSSIKAAILHFSKNMVYLQPEQIRVNCILPFTTDTPMLHKAIAEEPALKEAIDSSGGVIPIEAVIDGIVRLLEDPSYAGEALYISPEGSQFLPRT